MAAVRSGVRTCCGGRAAWSTPGISSPLERSHRAGAAPGAAWTPSGCCSRRGCGHPPTACRQLAGKDQALLVGRDALVALPPIVTLSGKPIVIVPELSPTSISFAVPEKVIVPPKDVAVDVVPSVTVIDELVKLELAIFDNVLFAASIVLLVNVSVDDAVM